MHSRLKGSEPRGSKLSPSLQVVTAYPGRRASGNAISASVDNALGTGLTALHPESPFALPTASTLMGLPHSRRVSPRAGMDVHRLKSRLVWNILFLGRAASAIQARMSGSLSALGFIGAPIQLRRS